MEKIKNFFTGLFAARPAVRKEPQAVSLARIGAGSALSRENSDAMTARSYTVENGIRWHKLGN